MAKFTKYLFWISISLSLTSFVVIKRGGREIYPFYSWKLFSVPSGNKMESAEFRLYGVKNKVVKRINNSDSDLYDGNTKFTFINSYGEAIVKNQNVAENKIKLLEFAKTIEPNFDYYYLIEEKFNPQNLGTKNLNISSKIITTLR